MSTEHTIQLPFTTSHAFIVGIDEYQHLAPLSTAVNDAEAIAKNLEKQHGFTVHPPLLNAKYTDLKKLLTEQIPKIVGTDDRILFYFAGHGIALDGEEGPNGYLVAADTKPGNEKTLIPMNDLHDALTTLPCRHGLLVLDCCFSGAFKWSSGFRDVVFDMPKIVYEERFWRYCKDPAWQVITSAAHDQKAVDIITNQSLGLREEGSSNHSPFANSLLRALDGEGDIVPAGSGDGVMTATELYSYLRDTVETQTTENAKRQSPSIFNLKRHGKGEFIFLNPNHRFNLPPTPNRNPFMGLSSYNEEDASLFYGRDKVVEALLAKTKKQSLLVVSGASGTGKSSVIKAGVLPQLRKQAYHILPIIRPGKEPMQTIATELPDIEKQLAHGKAALVIDQYEELITQCLHPEERIAFEKQIAEWLKQYPELKILLSIRSDFEPQFESEILAPWWQKGRYVVPAFSLEEIREVIIKPAAQAVLFYEPDDLVEQLSEEVSQAPGALPLLSFTLSELYHKYLKSGREDRALTEADYNELGGVIGALRTRADAEYQALKPDEKSSMRKLMLRMVSLEGGELAGKRVYTEELQFSNTAETERIRDIAGKLVEARLLLQGKDGQGKNYVEPAHDALVRAWARLWEWIKTVGEEKITLQYKLSQAVNDYNGLLKTEPKKARNLLWSNNPRLDLLKMELDGKDHGFNALEETFVTTSIKRRAARKRTNWTIAISVMAGLALLALYAFSQQKEAEKNLAQAEENFRIMQDSTKAAQQQRVRANSEASRAISNSLASQALLLESTDPTTGIRLAEESWKYFPENTNTLGAILSSYNLESSLEKENLYRKTNQFPPASNVSPNAETQEKHEIIQRQRMDPDANGFYKFGGMVGHIFSKSQKYELILHGDPHGDFSIEVWDLQQMKKVFDEQIGFDRSISGDLNFYSASFSKNERYIVIPDGSTAKVWNLNGARVPLAIMKAPAKIFKVIFDGPNDDIVAETEEGEVLLWSLNNSQLCIGDQYSEKDLLEVYSDEPNQKFVLVYDENEVEIWNNEGQKTAPSGSQQLIYSGKQQAVLAGGQTILDLSSYTRILDYEDEGSPSEKYNIDIEKNTKRIIIREKSNDQIIATLKGHNNLPTNVLFSPDGQYIISASSREIKFWNWRGRNFYSTNYGGHIGFLPNGKGLCVMGVALYEYFPIGYFEIIPLDPQEIIDEINNNDIYQLSSEDRIRLNLD